MKLKRALTIILLMGLLGLLTALIAILSGFLTTELPPALTSHPLLIWLLLGAMLLLSALLGYWLYRAQSAIDSSPSIPRYQHRQRMLAKVRAFWITGVLDHSLYDATLIKLGLQEQPAAGTNPWAGVLQPSEQSAGPLPSDAAIVQIFDRSGGELLILGEPGSGKTTLLLELARDLLARAEKGKEHHIPVILNLSSWAIKRQSISNWLVEELNTKYQVPRKLGLFWVENDQLLLLLDGLDEVIQEQRAACVEAINAFRQEHDVPMVVCSRRGEYLTSIARLALRTVVVQPLTDQQIDVYLSSVGEPLAGLRSALRVNPTLRDLATSPLMLSVLSLTYQGRAVDHFLAEADSTLQQRIFSTYVQRMLQRRGGGASYSPQQTLRWLRWLAQQLIQHNQTEFYLERMQPDWLADQRSQ